MSTEQTFLGDTTKISCLFGTQVDFSWMEYVLFRSEFMGQVVTVSDADRNYFLQRGYFYGMEQRNGITAVGPFKMQPFATIFGIDEVDGNPTQL